MRICCNKWLLSVILVIYFTTFLIILPLYCSELVYSIYLSSFWTKSELQDQATLNNFVAASNTRNYINELQSSQPHSSVDLNGKVNLAIVVISVRRVDNKGSDFGYLTRVVAALDQLIKADRLFVRKTLDVCNVEPGPGRNTEATGLSHLFNVTTRYPNGNTTVAVLDPFERERVGYVYCSRLALAHNASQVLVVEDDAEVLDDLFTVLHNTLHHLRDRDKHWSLIKLYYPERWQGYSFETLKLLELGSVAVIGGFISLMLWLIMLHPPCSRSSISARSHSHSSRLIFLSGALYSVLICLVIGRQHLLVFRRTVAPVSLGYSLVPAPGCCTPAVLYQSEALTTLMNELDKVKCTSTNPLDKALWNILNKRNFNPGYLIQPNLVRHIGLISTLKGISTYPQDFLL